MANSPTRNNGFEPGLVNNDFKAELYKLPEEFKGKKNIPLKSTPELEEVFRRHNKAMYVLTEKDRLIPSIEEMEHDLNEPEDSAYWKKQIEEAQKEHEEDLDRLYVYHTQHWYQDQMDQYHSYSPEFDDNPVDDTQKMEVDGDDDGKAVPELILEYADNFESLRYTHLARLVYLEAQYNKLREEEERIRKERDAHFPQTIDEYYEKDTDAQLRVAKFLRLDGDGPSGKSRQEKMMGEFGWAWRQVEPLLQAFKSNVSFVLWVGARANICDAGCI
ncbi:hypothetical protein BDQ17DRAFT_1251623 [Cyathus striatus]|nr:hypothetical protein BDQ17DRAFT_1251623 [Cyathus striatus]